MLNTKNGVNNMKNIKLSLITIALGLTTLSASAQTFARFDDNADKRHRFGFGITSDIFAGGRGLNNFMSTGINLFGGDDSDNLHFTSSHYYSLFFEYQYNFTSNWYLSSRLKFNIRRVLYDYSYYHGGTSMNVNISDLEIPVAANFKLPMSEYNHSYWIASLGGGVKFHISNNDPTIDVTAYTSNSNPNKVNVYHVDFEIKDKINYFLYISTGFEFPFKSHKFQTFMSYTAYLKQDYKFNHYSYGANFHRNLSSSPFRQNNWEFGVTFFL